MTQETLNGSAAPEQAQSATAKTYETITLELDYPIAVVTLNRPDKLNALSGDLQREVIEVFDTLEADDQVRAVVLTGAGRAFSAGFDIASGDEDESKFSVMQWKESMHSCDRFLRRIWHFRKPVVAAVHGYCLAGACELAMVCDMTIADEDCKLGEPEIRFATGSPLLIMPWVVPMKIARQLLYSGSLVTAQRAYEIGMINEVAPRGEYLSRAKYHARLISKVSPLAVQLTKEGLNRTYEIMGFASAVQNHINLVAIMDGSETEEFRQFEEIRLSQGLRAALAWRDQQFSEVEGT